MKTRTLVILVSIVGLCIAGFAYWAIVDLGTTVKENQEVSTKDDSIASLKAPNTTVNGDYLSERAFQDTLHAMTHQKVKAQEKWSHYRITEERIDALLETLENVEGTKYEYNNQEFYKVTLEAWKQGDFSNAVEAHNRIWNMQDGNIGRATDLLSEVEETQYINENFE